MKRPFGNTATLIPSTIVFREVGRLPAGARRSGAIEGVTGRSSFWLSVATLSCAPPCGVDVPHPLKRAGKNTHGKVLRSVLRSAFMDLPFILDRSSTRGTAAATNASLALLGAPTERTNSNNFVTLSNRYESVAECQRPRHSDVDWSFACRGAARRSDQK
jgi:hypothetical protein